LLRTLNTSQAVQLDPKHLSREVVCLKDLHGEKKLRANSK